MVLTTVKTSPQRLSSSKLSSRREQHLLDWTLRSALIVKKRLFREKGEEGLLDFTFSVVCNSKKTLGLGLGHSLLWFSLTQSSAVRCEKQSYELCSLCIFKYIKSLLAIINF